MVGNYKNKPGGALYRSELIARAEGGRIQSQATMNACRKAKDIGADVVKKWSATLDGVTRESHWAVNGEIREIDEKFSNGLMFPHDPAGGAAEVCSCRCCLLQKARWSLEAVDTKALGNVSTLSDKRKKQLADKLNIPVDKLDEYSGQIIPINAKSYEDFKQKYNELWHYEGSDLQKQAEARIAGYKAKQKKASNTPKDSKPQVKTYTAKELDKMSEAELREVAINNAIEYYKSGKSGISFGGADVTEAAKALAQQGSKTSLKKDILSIQKKLLENSDKSSKIESDGMSRKQKDPSYIEPMPKKQLQRIVKNFEKSGGLIQMNDATDALLQKKKVEGLTLNADTILLKQHTGRAAVFEELIHSAQYRTGRNDGSYISRLVNEIEAQEKLLKWQKVYKLTTPEIEATKKNLEGYKTELENFLKGGK